MLNSDNSPANPPLPEAELGRLRSSLERALTSIGPESHELALHLTEDGKPVDSFPLSSDLIKTLVQRFGDSGQHEELPGTDSSLINMVEAARLLNVSTAFVHRLVDQGQFHATGQAGDQLLSLVEILDYKRQRHAHRMTALQNLVDESQALNLGY